MDFIYQRVNSIVLLFLASGKLLGMEPGCLGLKPALLLT